MEERKEWPFHNGLSGHASYTESYILLSTVCCLLSTVFLIAFPEPIIDLLLWKQICLGAELTNQLPTKCDNSFLARQRLAHSSSLYH